MNWKNHDLSTLSIYEIIYEARSMGLFVQKENLFLRLFRSVSIRSQKKSEDDFRGFGLSNVGLVESPCKYRFSSRD